MRKCDSMFSNRKCLPLCLKHGRFRVFSKNRPQSIDNLPLGSIYPDAFDKLQDYGAVEQVTENIFAVAPGFTHLYDATFGLIVGDEPSANPEVFII